MCVCPVNDTNATCPECNPFQTAAPSGTQNRKKSVDGFKIEGLSSEVQWERRFPVILLLYLRGIPNNKPQVSNIQSQHNLKANKTCKNKSIKNAAVGGVMEDGGSSSVDSAGVNAAGTVVESSSSSVGATLQSCCHSWGLESGWWESQASSAFSDNPAAIEPCWSAVWCFVQMRSSLMWMPSSPGLKKRGANLYAGTL